MEGEHRSIRQLAKERARMQAVAAQQTAAPATTAPAGKRVYQDLNPDDLSFVTAGLAPPAESAAAPAAPAVCSLLLCFIFCT